MDWSHLLWPLVGSGQNNCIYPNHAWSFGGFPYHHDILLDWLWEARSEGHGTGSLPSSVADSRECCVLVDRSSLSSLLYGMPQDSILFPLYLASKWNHWTRLFMGTQLRTINMPMKLSYTFLPLAIQAMPVLSQWLEAVWAWQASAQPKKTEWLWVLWLPIFRDLTLLIL